MDKSLQGLAVLRVLKHPAMLRLWLAQVIYLSVQFTASYAMIVLITNETHSAIMVGLVIIALSLPLVLFGAPAGALVDRMDRRFVLWVSNIVRAVATALFVLALLLSPNQFLFIYVLAFFFSLVGLFFSPAEGALIPRLVDEDELLPALSLYNLTLNMSQALGLLLLGPLVLTLIPPFKLPFAGGLIFTPMESLFAGITLLYLIATLLTASLPRESGQPHQAAKPEEVFSEGVEATTNSWRRMLSDLREGWQLVRGDSILLDALFQSCYGGLIMLTIAEIATTFVQRLLELPTSYTAVVFAPAGVGLVLGSLLVPTVVARLKSIRTMALGMVVTAFGLGLVPLSLLIARGLDPTHWSTNILSLTIVALLTAFVGFGLDLVIVPAQTLMQQRSPDAMRGRVLALYQVLFNGGAIPVMLFMGALTDIFGIVTVIFVISGMSLLMALLTIFRASHHSEEPELEKIANVPIPIPLQPDPRETASRPL